MLRCRCVPDPASIFFCHPCPAGRSPANRSGPARTLYDPQLQRGNWRRRAPVHPGRSRHCGIPSCLSASRVDRFSGWSLFFVAAQPRSSETGVSRPVADERRARTRQKATLRRSDPVRTSVPPVPKKPFGRPSVRDLSSVRHATGRYRTQADWTWAYGRARRRDFPSDNAEPGGPGRRAHREAESSINNP